MRATQRSPQEEFLDNIDDDEARSIVRRCLIPADRLQMRAEIGRGRLQRFTFVYIMNFMCGRFWLSFVWFWRSLSASDSLVINGAL